jgi:Zn-dependent M28 family amino/carboxypeptidase
LRFIIPTTAFLRGKSLAPAIEDPILSNMGIVSKRRTLLLSIGLAGACAAAFVGCITQPMVSASASKPPPVDPALLEAHVKKLSVDLYPRSYDQFRNLDLAARHIAEQFKASGATVVVQDVVVQEITYKNIIGRFGPEQGPLLVIGAHYDSHGDPGSATQGLTPDTHTPGADDNASGVAGLLELARLLGRERPARSIELVAYTLEEPPHFRSEHMGSVWHARSLKAAKRDVQLMLSLEMIGSFSDAPGSQQYPVPGMSLFYPDRGNFIALVGKFGDFGHTRRAKTIMSGATDLPVFSINAPRLLQGIDFSDHRSYWAEDYPAMMITDTAFLRNAHYHRAGDTHEKLDFPRMAKVVQSVFALTQQY